jgi:predicted chitinase
MVTKAELQSFLPGADPELIAAVVNGWQAAEDAEINTHLRKHHFLSNIAVETGGLKSIVEGMSYSSTARLRAVWPSRFKTDAAARPFVRNPEGLAIKVYGGRMGNAPSPSDDGWRFRGGGMMQTTGREGYRKMGFEDNPEELQSDPAIAFKIAVREWEKRRCNALADANNVVAVRRAINGGTNGLDDVKEYLRRAGRVWPLAGGASAAPKPTGQKSSLRAVQAQLVELGYPEVGKVDGKWGSKTRAAILAFKADRGLPLTVELDREFLAELMVAPKREVSEARATATVADLRQAGSRKIAAADETSAAGYITTGAGGFAAVGALKDQLGLTGSIVDQFSSMLETIKPIWPVALLALGAYIVWQQIKIKRAAVQDYREGKYVGR